MAIISTPQQGILFTVPNGYTAIVRAFRISSSVGLILDTDGNPIDPLVNFYVDGIALPNFSILGSCFVEQDDWNETFFIVGEGSSLSGGILYNDDYFIPAHTDNFDIRGNVLPTNGVPSNLIVGNVKNAAKGRSHNQRLPGGQRIDAPAAQKSQPMQPAQPQKSVQYQKPAQQPQQNQQYRIRLGRSER